MVSFTRGLGNCKFLLKSLKFVLRFWVVIIVILLLSFGTILISTQRLFLGVTLAGLTGHRNCFQKSLACQCGPSGSGFQLMLCYSGPKSADVSWAILECLGSHLLPGIEFLVGKKEVYDPPLGATGSMCTLNL